MRGIRSLGLFLLYLGAQIVALALAFPFLSEGLSTTNASTANNPYGPIYLIVLIVLAPILILFVARRNRGPQTIRLVILAGIAFSLAITLDATLALLLPRPRTSPRTGWPSRSASPTRWRRSSPSASSSPC